MIYRLPLLVQFQKLYSSTFLKHTLHVMGDTKVDTMGLPLKEVVTALNKFANLSLAASWDNVGLLIEPTTPKLISHALLTNDLTEAVMQEAIDVKADLIISYHPPIFKPLKSVTTTTWKERIVAKCLENKIALYSPHTSFDSIKGGVNDWLISAFSTNIESTVPIVKDAKNEENGMGRFCTLKHALPVHDVVNIIKKLTGLQYIRVAYAPDTGKLIKTVAVCAGAGTSILQGVSADLYLTGEMLHHDVLDAVHCGTNVILTNHSDSERGYLKKFAVTLNDILNKTVKISVSVKDADPLVTV